MRNARILTAWGVLVVSAAGCTTEQDLGRQDVHDTGNELDATQLDAGNQVDDAGREPDANDASVKDSAAKDAPANDVVAPNPDASAAADSAVVPNAKRVFQTGGTYTGDLKTEGGGTTGVEGADKLCGTAALAASLGGAWRAWISSSTENAYTRIADVSPWYFVDRKTKVFDNKTGLLQGSLKVGPLVDITMSEFGTTNAPVNTWTGTKISGVPSPAVSQFTCKDWTNNQAIGGYEGLVGIGIFSTLSWWTDSVTTPCKLAGRLYCFEQ